jgi:hypothetical protein
LRRGDGNGPHAGVDDHLNVPVVELGFGQINHDGPHARVDLGQAPYLPTTVESDFAHRGCDLEIPIRTVKSRLAAARAALCRALNKEKEYR